MVDIKMKNLRGSRRRSFLKLLGAAGAGIGLERSRFLNYLADSGGHALADESTCGSINRSVHIYAGTGDLSWFTLLWPMVDIAHANNHVTSSNSLNGKYAYHASSAAGFTDAYEDPMSDLTRTAHYGPQAPWINWSGPGGPARRHPDRYLTAIMQGTNETHLSKPKLGGKVASGVDIAAVAAAIQAEAAPCLLPVLSIGQNASPGLVAGMPEVANVRDGFSVVELFNSAASRGLLAAERDKALFSTYYRAVLGLHAAADLPTWKQRVETARTSADLLGLNYEPFLAPTQADLELYGVAQVPSGIGNDQFENLRNLAHSLISVAKAMSLGLMNTAVIDLQHDNLGGPPGKRFRDPHGAFLDLTALTATVQLLGQILDAFYLQLETLPDPTCESKNLDGRVVLSIHGDTPKEPLKPSSWPDGTPEASNWMYVMGAGFLKGGWFGRVAPNPSQPNNAIVWGFDPASGQEIQGASSIDTTNAAGAAVIYAITRGQMDRVDAFSSGLDITGLVRANGS